MFNVNEYFDGRVKSLGFKKNLNNLDSICSIDFNKFNPNIFLTISCTGKIRFKQFLLKFALHTYSTLNMKKYRFWSLVMLAITALIMTSCDNEPLEGNFISDEEAQDNSAFTATSAANAIGHL